MLRLVKSRDSESTAPPQRLPLGWGLKPAAQPGTASANKAVRKELVTAAEEGHLMTIAPTGAGKGRSVIIPTLLSYPGPVIVVDPKGENYAVTARRRREMGQAVYLLDPFRITGQASHSFNVLDQIELHRPDAYDQALAMAELIVPKRPVHDPFWDDNARSLITALLLWVVEDRLPESTNLMEVAHLLHCAELRQELGRMQRSLIEQIRNLASGFTATEPRVMATILTTARTAVTIFIGNSFAYMSEQTDIPLDGVERGDPVSIYLVLPPDRLDSHGRMLRLWIGCLMDRIGRRRHPVKAATLFMLDEAAQLGTLQQLRRAITLMRGYGLRTWTFWQDLSQLQCLYDDWETLYNNTRYIQTFGATTHLLASKLGTLLNLPSDIDPLRLSEKRLILAEAGCAPRVAGRLDYLVDAMFQGRFDDNPFYQPAQPRPRATPQRKRHKHLATERREAALARWDHVADADREPEPEPEREDWWEKSHWARRLEDWSER